MKRLMMQAIGLAALIVVLAVFLPKVLDAIETFLLTFFEIATGLIGDIKDLQLK